MASPAPVAARAARAFAAPRPVTNGESARTRLGPRLFWRPDAASSPRPGPARARATFSFSSPGSSRRALRRLGFFIEPFVVAAAAEGDGSSAFWDAGDDGPPPAHRGYAPVPGFGEYYVPPKPPKPEKSARDGARVAPDGAPLPPPPPPKRAPSKLLQEPAQAGIWERPSGTPNGAAPSIVQPRSFGDDLRAVRSDPPFSPGGLGEQAAPASVGVAVASVVPYDANATDQNANASDVSNDPELLRLRATYRLLTRMAGWLRYLFPVTGGLACWVAAGASLGGVFAKLVPQMVNVVNVLTFALAATLGASACLGAFLVVALVGRALRNALFGDWETLDAASKPVEPYDYPTHPGLLAQARAQSEQEMRYRAAQMEQARANELRYEEYQRRYERSRAVSNAVSTDRRDGSGSASFSGSAIVAADSYVVDRWDGGSWDESDAYYPDASFDDVVGTLNRSRDVNAYEEEEEEEEKEAFAARAPPKRKRVDLPIETLMGLGGETLSAVGSEWQTQRQREAASQGGGAAGAANEAAGGNRRNDGKETGAGAPAPPPPQWRQQPPPSQPAQARAAPAPTPAPAPAPAPAPVMRGGKVDWDPDALMRDMGYGAPAPPPAPAAPEKKNGGGWFGGFFGGGFGGGTKEAPAPAPAPVTPPPPPEPEVDPVLAMLGGGGAHENPNAARAAEAAARAPSGDYYLSPTQEQSKEQFEEMQRRRDEWNNRVQRAVKRKDGGRGEGARGDGA